MWKVNPTNIKTKAIQIRKNVKNNWTLIKLEDGAKNNLYQQLNEINCIAFAFHFISFSTAILKSKRKINKGDWTLWIHWHSNYFESTDLYEIMQPAPSPPLPVVVLDEDSSSSLGKYNKIGFTLAGHLFGSTVEK